MRNIYDKLLNVNFEQVQKFQNLNYEDKNDREHLRSLDIEQINAMKRELMQGKKTNDAINNQLDSLERYNKIADNKFRHNYEKLEKSRNTATPWKKGGFIVAGVCAAIGGILFLTKFLPFISGVFGPLGVVISLLAIVGLGGYGVYKYASSYKEDAEKKQLMGLMQHGEALRKHTISAQAGLITSTYTNAEDIPLIQRQVHVVQNPVGLEANERFYKGKDDDDDDDDDDDNKDKKLTSMFDMLNSKVEGRG